MNPQEVFRIRTKKDFERTALKVFRIQAENNSIYKNYIQELHIDPAQIRSLEKIPFLPIEFFKTHDVVTPFLPGAGRHQHVFLSSGTTGAERSKHIVQDVSLYEKSFSRCFELFFGDVKKYAVLALLPSYYENKSSSLIYMTMNLIRESKNLSSGFFNAKDETIIQTIKELLKKKKKILLLGVSFALLDLAEKLTRPYEDTKNLMVMETGGMKGRREEMTREELHKILAGKFGVNKIFSEYGMTELLSQAYSKGGGLFKCPSWMHVLARDANDPFQVLPAGRSGALNIIDLANIHSCSFIATQDAGRVHKNGVFEVLGRMDNSDLRGCNLLVQ